MNFVIENTNFSTANLGSYPFAIVVSKINVCLARPIAQSVYALAAQDAVLRHAHLILNDTGAIRFLHSHFTKYAPPSPKTTNIVLCRKEHTLSNIKDPKTATYIIDDFYTPYLRLIGIHLASYLFSRYYINSRISDVISWMTYMYKNKNKNRNIINIEDIYGIIFEFMNSKLRSKFVIYPDDFKPLLVEGPLSIEVAKRWRSDSDEDQDAYFLSKNVDSYANNINVKFIINNILASLKWHIHDKYILNDFYLSDYDKDTGELKIVIVVQYLEFFLFALRLASPIRLASIMSAMVNKIYMYKRKFERN